MKHLKKLVCRFQKTWLQTFLIIVLLALGKQSSTACSDSYSNLYPEVTGSYTSPSGKSFTSSGTYSDTIVNASGCDSIITIHLTVGTSGRLQWLLEQQLIPVDTNWNHGTGEGVDIGSRYALVGAPWDNLDENDSNSKRRAGSVYLYEKSGGSWSLKRKLVASDRSADAFFGDEVAVSGNYGIIAASGDGGRAQGAVYIFDLDSNSPYEIQKLVAPIRKPLDLFGQSVSIDGDFAVVGAMFEDEDANDSNSVTNAGSAYIYQNISGTWTLVQKIVASDRDQDDAFGRSVAISGKYIIVGTPLNSYDSAIANYVNTAGAVHVFENVNGTWTQIKKIVATKRSTGANFGWRVAMKGDYAVIGAYQDPYDQFGADSIEYAGAAYIIKNNSGSWTHLQKIVASDRSHGDAFGTIVDISGNHLIVGATEEVFDADGLDSLFSAGAVYMYENHNDVWQQTQKLVSTQRISKAQFGLSAAVFGDRVIVGSSRGKNLSGDAHVFTATCNSWVEISDTTCETYVSPSGKYMWFQSGIYSDTITNQNGCDSIMRIHLTVHARPEISDSIAFKDGSLPGGVVTDDSGNMYITSQNRHLVLKVSPDGQVDTLAGSTSGYQDGVGTAAQFHLPGAIAIGKDGNLYVAETTTGRIRKITPTGVVSTVVTRTSSDLNYASGLAVDHDGNIYVTDFLKHRITKITSSGQVSIFAGTGSPGYKDTIRSHAQFFSPNDIAMGDSGEMYVADFDNHRIRKISPDGTVTTVAGNGTAQTIDGIGTAASLRRPNSLQYKNGRLYVAEWNKARCIYPNGQVTTIGSFDRTADVAVLGDTGILVVAQGRDKEVKRFIFSTGDAATYATVYDTVCDIYTSPSGRYTWFRTGTYSDTFVNHNGCDSILTIKLLVKARPTVELSTLAGSSRGFADGTGQAAKFNNPNRMARDSAGNIYVADGVNNRIRKVTPDGIVTTLAGGSRGYADGTGTQAKFYAPTDLAVAPNGDIFVVDSRNNRIRKVTPSGVVTTFAGSGKGYRDGNGTYAYFSYPYGITIDSLGNLFVADILNHRIRKITPSGDVSTVAGNGSRGHVDGPRDSALFFSPFGVECGPNGSLYVVDVEYSSVRKIDSSGYVTTIVGSADESGFVDGSGATARFSTPYGIDLDQDGNLLVADYDNHAIRAVSSESEVTTVFSSVGGYADGINENARIRHPWAVLAGDSNEIFVIGKNNRVRKMVLSQGSATTYSEISEVACETYTSPSGRYTWIQSGIYHDTLVNSVGCDSVVRINLTVNADPEFSQSTFISKKGFNSSVMDDAGNLYYTNSQSNLILKRGPSGELDTIAGSTRGYRDGVGTAAQFYAPGNIIRDKWGNLFVVETSQHRVRKVTPDGVVSTIASQSSAQLTSPYAVAVDDTGNVYIADAGNHRIRKVTPDGNVSTYAGTGSYGYLDTIASLAQFYSPLGIALGDSGEMFVADRSNHRIRRISTDGVVTTIAGDGVSRVKDGIGLDASFKGPTSLVYVNGRLYIGGTDKARCMYPDGKIITVGNTKLVKSVGYAGDTALLINDALRGNAKKVVFSPGYAVSYGTAYDTACETYVSQSGRNTWYRSGIYLDTIASIHGCDSVLTTHLTIRATPQAEVNTLAGGSRGYVDDTATAAKFNTIGGMDMDSAGNIFVADASNNRIRKITPDGVVTTFAGSSAGFADGNGTAAKFRNPAGLRVASNGDIYVADVLNNRIRKITPSGDVTTVAGSGVAGNGNGHSTTAEFNNPYSLALDDNGNIYVADGNNGLIRKINSSGAVSNYAGSTRGYMDGPASTAQFQLPLDLEFDDSMNLYVADGLLSNIRKISASGQVTTVAGKAGANGFADGSDTNARFYVPAALAFDDIGNLLVADYENNRLRKVSPLGEVTTVCGSLIGYQDGVDDEIRMKNPRAMTTDGDRILFADNNDAIRKVSLSPGRFETRGGSRDVVVYDSFTDDYGMVWTESGILYDTLVNSVGCDSLRTVNLTVIHRLYVDSSAASGGNGRSWNTPFKTLTEALNEANTHDEHNAIFMRSGTYYPVNHRDSSFEIINANIKIYGGFTGNELTPEDRQSGAAPTILCGDIGRKGDSSDNVYHVMIIRPDSSVSFESMIIDGLTIQGGFASGNRGIYYGGTKIYQTEGAALAIVGSGRSGQQIHPWISNCTFRGNNGDYAAVFIQAKNGVARPVITGCDFIGNASKYGTIFLDGKSGEVSPIIENSVFDQNYSATSGGAIYSYSYFGKASPNILSCVFSENMAHSHGAAIYNNGYGGTCSPTITNSTFYKNAAGQSAGMMYNFGNSGTCAPVVTNSISSGNSASGDTAYKFSELYNYGAYPYVQYSAMQLGSSSYSSSTANSLNGGTNNLYQVAPGFVGSSKPRGADGVWRTGDDGLRLNARSSWVNSGKNGIRPENDILGNQRNGNTDLGAYEYVDCGLSVALAKSTGTHTASYAVNDGDYTCYCNDNNELLLALDTNGSGAVISPSQVKLYIGNPSTISYNSSGGMISNPAGGVILERRWDVDPTTQPTGTVGVKYFYTNDNFNDLKTAMANLSNPTTLSSPTELQFYKVKGGSSATFPNPHDSGVYGIVLTNGAMADTNIWVAGKHGVQDHSAEYLVTSFSGGGGGGGGGSAPLPVDLVEFAAVATENHTAKLSWVTASEVNNSHFVLERSYNGRDYEDIALVNGQGTKSTPTEYDYDDRSIALEENKVFYRLRQMDFDGTTTLSPVRLIWYNATEQIARTLLFPNPTSGSVTLILPEDETDHSYNVLDNQGRVLITGTTNSSQETINLAQFPTGLYFVTIDTGESFKVIKK